MAPSEGWGPALKRHRVHVFVPALPDLEPTWSTNWMAMAKGVPGIHMCAWYSYVLMSAANAALTVVDILRVS